MSESAPRINPEDVFPRRNLPGEAEQWGRVMEDRTRELEKNVVSVNQSLHGANRGTAAQLASISDQLTAISDAQATLADQQQTLSAQQTQLSDQQQTLSDQQTQLSTVTTRLYETFDYRVFYDTLNSNSNTQVASFDIPSPSWAFNGVVTTSFGVESGSQFNSTTRTARYSTFLRVADSPSLGHINLLVGSAEYSDDRWEPVVSHPVSASSGWARGFITRNVTASGSGTIYPQIIVSVTWFGNPFAPLTETPPETETFSESETPDPEEY